MTTLRFNTIWDLPLFSPRDLNEDESKTQTAPVTERFLTIWSRPLARLPKAGA